MSLRTRGQEATIQITVDGRNQEGSWAKVKDFTATPRTDLVEENYLGELESDLDIMHHGYDLSFTVDMQDSATINYLQDIVAREQLATRHPVVNITVTYAFREGTATITELYTNVFLKVSEQTISGRSEYISVGFEGKAKRKLTL